VIFAPTKTNHYQYMKKLFTFLVGSLVTVSAMAQTLEETQSSLQNTQNELAALKKLKFSGYVQAQYQVADSVGVASMEAGNFAAGNDKRFMVRRGRLKAAYTNTNDEGIVTSEFVLQSDFSEKGFLLRDAYCRFLIPYTKNFLALKSGIFDRPFGYEIAYSSSLRETPERGRMSQLLFPGERELGAMLIFEGPKGSRWEWLKMQGGYFGGNGAYVPVGGDVDFKKDFIGQIILKKSFMKERLKVSGGLSYYNGGVAQGSDTSYTFNSDSKMYEKHVYKGSKNTLHLREYVGGDLQISFDSKIGLTTLRAEYIEGTQPSIGSNSVSPSFSTITGYSSYASTSSLPTTSFTVGAPGAPAFNLYSRHFSGYYLYFVQNIAHSKHDIVVKYDVYDPNTKVSGGDLVDQVKLTSSSSSFTKTKVSQADIKYHTIGLGYIYHLDENIKISLYYAMVTNESTSAGSSSGSAISHFARDIKDNVFTARVQYKF
jgi:hypothetical protein